MSPRRRTGLVSLTHTRPPREPACNQQLMEVCGVTGCLQGYRCSLLKVFRITRVLTWHPRKSDHRCLRGRGSLIAWRCHRSVARRATATAAPVLQQCRGEPGSDPAPAAPQCCGEVGPLSYEKPRKSPSRDPSRPAPEALSFIILVGEALLTDLG